MLDYEPVSSHQAQAFVSGKSGPRPPRRGGSFESETGFVSDKSGPRPPRRGGSFESETGFVSDKSGPRPPRRGGSFESETGFVSDKSGPRPPRRGGSFESETGFVSDKTRQAIGNPVSCSLGGRIKGSCPKRVQSRNPDREPTGSGAMCFSGNTVTQGKEISL